MGSWINDIERKKNAAKIVYRLYMLEEGLTFGELLKETKLSKPVLAKHLRRLMNGTILIQEGVGRERKYKVHPELAELIRKEGEDSYVDTIFEVIRNKTPKNRKAQSTVAKFWKGMEEKVKTGR